MIDQFSKICLAFTIDYYINLYQPVCSGKLAGKGIYFQAFFKILKMVLLSE